MTKDKPGPLIAGLQRRLLLLLVVVLLPVFSFFVAQAWQAQRDELAHARERLLVVSRLAALGAERHVEGTRQLLNAMSSAPSLKDNALGMLCGAFVANIRSSYSYYTNLGLINSDGRMICHALPVDATGDYRARSYFTQALATKSFSMGLYQVGQLTGVSSVGFAMPVYDPQQQFKGLAFAGLEISQLAKALTASLPPDLRVTLTDREGTVIGVDPSQSKSLIGTRFPGPLLSAKHSPLAGETVEVADADGVPMVYGISTVADDGGPAIYVLASQPRSAITAPAWRALTHQLLWIALTALLGGAMARWVANRTLVAPASNLLTQITRLGRDAGLPAAVPQPGLDAMASLSSAFDRFAQLLRQRDNVREQQQAALQTVQSRLLVAQRIADIGNWELDLASQQLWWSEQTFVIFGLEPTLFTPTLERVAGLVFPEDRARYDAAIDRFFDHGDPLEIECRMVGRAGKIRWIRKLGEMQRDDQGHPVSGCGTVQDITDRVINERLLSAESRALLALSLDMPLNAVLEEVLIGMESVLPGACATILLLDADGQHFQTAVAPGLPASYGVALEGVAIGPAVGSCGTAAYRRETVIVDDIETDPLWADHRELAEAHGLRACWATPVQNSVGAVLATFAIYYKTPRKPCAEELELAQRAASVIGIAIERERRDVAFRASELRFRSSFLGASAGMVILTLEGRVVEVNSAYCRMLGYTAAELYDRSTGESVHPKDLPRRRAHIEALKRGQVASVVEEDRYLTKAGETVWIRVSISRVQGVTRLSDGFVLIAEDINEQHNTMLALQQTQAALNMASRVGRLGAWWVDLDKSDAAFQMSDVACEICGMAPGTVLTKGQAAQPFVGDHGERLTALFDRCALAAESFDVEQQLINAAGQPVWLRTIGEAVHSAEGHIVRVQGTIQDISTRKQAQIDLLQLNAELEGRVALRTAQLESANKELEAFSYSVSHDLRAPLQTVSGFLDLLDKSNGANLTDKGKHYLQRIRTSSGQMNDLIQGLMSLAELNRKPLKTGRVNLSAVAERVAQDCRDLDPDRKIDVQVQAGMQVHGDPTLLMVVMQNLLGNAWKYTSKRSAARIEVGAERHAGDTVVYFVRDNGAGFDMAYANLLFGAFQRLHSAAEFSGTGIGLANVKRVICRHGGRVWARGQLGEGATFYFTLAPDPEDVNTLTAL